MRFSVSILDYLGKYQDGVLVLLTIKYNDVYYDATYYYNKEHLLLTINENFEIELGHLITDDSDYVELIRYIITKVVPYDEIFNRLDEYVPKENPLD